MADSFYIQTGPTTFDSSAATGSPWGPDSQHAGPPTALLVRAMELHDARPDSRLGRVSVDILAPIPVAPLDISVSAVKSGKRVELLEARAEAAGRAVLTARGWRMDRVAAEFPASSVTASVAAPLPPAAAVNLPGAYMAGYMSAIDWRFESGGFDVFGPSIAWARPLVSLLADEPLSAWQRTMIVTDSASGVSLVAHPRKHPVVNCDLTVVLFRDPRAEWIRLDATTTVSPGGGAAARAVVSDRFGQVGESLQTLFAAS